jgi:alpha-L-rhamnosidase
MIRTRLFAAAIIWRCRGNKPIRIVAVALLFATVCGRVFAASSLLPPGRLVCEHQNDPLAASPSHPSLGWQLAAASATERGVRQTAYRVLVASTSARLETNHADLWDSGRVVSGRTADIEYAGKSIPAEHRAFWKVEVWDERGASSGWSAVAQLTAAPERWTAQWIAAATGADGKSEGVTQPMPVFRKAFSMHKPVARALLYVAGLGQDEVHLNGMKVGDRELTPGWTDYRKHVLYDTYDVTGLLRTGQNAIGVLLGNGMFNVARVPGRYTKFAGSFGPPQLIAELHLLFRDGSSETIATGNDWQTAPGPIVFSSSYGGEDYDARKEPAGWDSSEAGEKSATESETWHDAIVVPGPGGQLDPEIATPIRVEHIYHPVAHRTLASGAQVFDLGQNFAGWPEIAIRGEAGAQIKLICGELLNPDGSVSQESANAHPGRAQWFSYTLRGGREEHWHPRFSYYGFRYVQAEITGNAHLVSLAGDAVYSSATPSGDFRSSVPLLNRIHALILHAEENNLASVITDCPHREKLGWLEQTHLMGSALNYDFDLEQLYAKVNQDMADEQKADGSVPTIAPQFTVFGAQDNPFNDSPEWGSAAVLDPWIAFERYGDLETLRTQYPVMRRYVEYLASRSHDGIIDYGLGDWYDIGLHGPGLAQLTSRALTGTAIYYQDLVALSAAAHQLGDADEETQLASLREAVAQAFQQRFYHADKHAYENGSQTADAMPLVVGLTPEADRASVLANLVADIRAHGNHVTAGDIGFHYVVDALMDNSASDVLLDMLLRKNSPSYGYQLAQGATALTEAWDARRGSSQDHLMLGDAEEWFYAGLGGIRVDFSRPQPEQIVIAPALLSRINSSQVDYRSVKGTIHVAWKHEPVGTRLDVVIPPNTSAVVKLPKAPETRILESGRPAMQSPGVSLLRRAGSSTDFRVESGKYHFLIVARR